jgi:phosphoribosylformylglycinamidine synthase subunit PurL
VDLAAQASALAALREAVRAGGLATVHDISEGGLAVALAECCIEGGLGAAIRLGGDEAVSGGEAPGGGDADAALFGEGPGGVVIAGPREAVEAVPGARVIGEVGRDALEIEGALSVSVAELRGVYEGAIPAVFA